MSKPRDTITGSVMAEIDVLNKEGKNNGKFQLSDELFARAPNEHLLYLSVVRQEANARAGTAHTKTRAEVRGGGAKPWKQKGTGRARAGSIRSPLWRGGGVMHGPRATGSKTHKGALGMGVNWSKDMNVKERGLALLSALITVHNAGNLVVLDDIKVANGKTKELLLLVGKLKLQDKKVLFVVDSSDQASELVLRASRNLVNVKTITDKSLNVKDLLKADKVVFGETALNTTQDRFKQSRAIQKSNQKNKIIKEDKMKVAKVKQKRKQTVTV